MRCPFAPCAADMDPVRELAAPGDREATREVYPMHTVVGAFTWFGHCPGGLAAVPLTAEAGRALVQEEVRLHREAVRRAGLPCCARSAGEHLSTHLGHDAVRPREEYFTSR